MTSQALPILMFTLFSNVFSSSLVTNSTPGDARCGAVYYQCGGEWCGGEVGQVPPRLITPLIPHLGAALTLYSPVSRLVCQEGES